MWRSSCLVFAPLLELPHSQRHKASAHYWWPVSDSWDKQQLGQYLFIYFFKQGAYSALYLGNLLVGDSLK